MKIAKMLGLVALVAIFGLSLTSCGGYSASAAEKMQQKYDDGDMTKDDYAKCIEWMEECYQDWEQLTEEGIKDVKNAKQWEKKKEEIEEQLESDWENISTIDELLTEAYYKDEEGMGSSNQKKFKNFIEKLRKKAEKLSEKLSKKVDDYSVELPELG